jgi:hypothetical protein
MQPRDLATPDDFTPTPAVRCKVLTVMPDGDKQAAKVREIGWDADGRALETTRRETLTGEQLNRLKLLWQAQRFFPVARLKDSLSETLYYESQEDRQRPQAQESPTIPDELEVWIYPTNSMAFQCQIPRTIAFSARPPEDLLAKDIGYSELVVEERRGWLTARVFWMNGQPSAEAETRWQPVIVQRVRDYLAKYPQQSKTLIVRGILEDSIRLGDDYRDLVLAGVDLKARLDTLKAKDYAPMAD